MPSVSLSRLLRCWKFNFIDTIHHRDFKRPTLLLTNLNFCSDDTALRLKIAELEAQKAAGSCPVTRAEAALLDTEQTRVDRPQ
jgi:hypothetical protein